MLKTDSMILFLLVVCILWGFVVANDFGNHFLKANLNTTACEVDQELEQLVKTNGSRSMMFVIYHNDSTGYAEQVAKTFARCKESWIKPVKIRELTPFFETLMYREFLPEYESEWKDLDYVIIGTYKTVLGIQIHPGIHFTLTLAEIKEKLLLARDYTGLNKGRKAEIIPFLRGKSLLMPMTLYFHGEDFLIAWNGILEALGYSMKDINYFTAINPFYRNVYIIKPQLLQKLVAFMQKAMKVAETDPKVKSLLEKDAKYVGGKEEVARRVFNASYYHLHPFVFERLPSFYLRSISAMVCHTKSGPCASNY